MVNRRFFIMNSFVLIICGLSELSLAYGFFTTKLNKNGCSRIFSVEMTLLCDELVYLQGVGELVSVSANYMMTYQPIGVHSPHSGDSPSLIGLEATAHDFLSHEGLTSFEVHENHLVDNDTNPLLLTELLSTYIGNQHDAMINQSVVIPQLFGASSPIFTISSISTVTAPLDSDGGIVYIHTLALESADAVNYTGVFSGTSQNATLSIYHNPDNLQVVSNSQNIGVIYLSNEYSFIYSVGHKKNKIFTKERNQRKENDQSKSESKFNQALFKRQLPEACFFKSEQENKYSNAVLNVGMVFILSNVWRVLLDIQASSF